jgi:restriction system protein
MDGHEFEEYCANVLKKNDYINVEITKGSGDHGVDILAERENGTTYAIQCKCYSSNIGNKAVQEIFSGKSIYNRHIGVVMTNQYFTPAAKEAASKSGILLWDRDYLEKMRGSEDITPVKTSSPFSTENTSLSSNNENITLDNSDIDDEMLEKAVEAVIDRGKASTSYLQLTFKIGYGKAAKLIDMMEKDGVVGKFSGSKPREILMTMEQWRSLKR